VSSPGQPPRFFLDRSLGGRQCPRLSEPEPVPDQPPFLTVKQQLKLAVPSICVIVCCLIYVHHTMQVMVAELRLDLPWMPDEPQHLGELAFRRGRDNVLRYDDGISLRVRVLDPGAYGSARALVDAAHREDGPGYVVLAAGAVPVGWRHELRHAELSFIDVSGVADIVWPRLRLSTRQFARPVQRRRAAVPLQKGHALVVQELLIATADGTLPTITELADHCGVSVSTASRAVGQLAGQGLVEKEHAWRHVAVRLDDRAELARTLAAQTAWPGREVIVGYAWGRNIWDVAATVSRNAADARIELAVTGRVGAAFHGILGTSSPSAVRCWVHLDGGRPLAEVAEQIGLEPAPEESANVQVSADTWRIGVHRHGAVRFDDWTATVAHPLRVWCDLHGEERGQEFAAQLRGALSHAQ
jgi:AraC-like DNA-binding protein